MIIVTSYWWLFATINVFIFSIWFNEVRKKMSIFNITLKKLIKYIVINLLIKRNINLYTVINVTVSMTKNFHFDSRKFIFSENNFTLCRKVKIFFSSVVRHNFYNFRKKKSILTFLSADVTCKIEKTSFRLSKFCVLK